MPDSLIPPYVGAPDPEELWMMYLRADGVQQVGSLASEANYQISLIAARLRSGEFADNGELLRAANWLTKVKAVRDACLDKLGLSRL
jgi:hypothetical protein